MTADRSILGPVVAAAAIGALSVGRASARAQEERPIAVRAVVPPGTYYVGQPIPLHIAAIAEGERPALDPPQIADAEVVRVGTRLRPVAMSGIGEAVSEVNQYLYDYRIVARRPGPLRIPPATARLGGRTGASRPIRLEVRPVPAAGQTGAFLGGVGRLAVTAGVDRPTVRVGEAIEYSLRLTGPGAVGSTRPPPSLSGFDRLGLGLVIEPSPAERTVEPPSRTFRWRLRPTRAGSASLPHVEVASFDPTLNRYISRVSPRIPIRVVAVPKFNPSTLEGDAVKAEVSPAWRLRRAWPTVGSWLVGWLGVIGASAALILAHALRGGNPRYVARQLARHLDASAGEEAIAGRIMRAFEVYLDLAAGHPGGALTPEEVRRTLGQIAGDPALADRAGALVARCDEARYAGRAASAEGLGAEARAFFTDLGRVKVRRVDAIGRQGPP